MATSNTGQSPAASVVSLKPQPPIIYFNIGWMKHYAGADPSDETSGGMGYLKENPYGAEAFNFLPNDQEMLLGYRAGHAKKLNLDCLGAAASIDHLDGVLVVWMAREPLSKRTMIVGWYDDARVYVRARPQPRLINGEAWPYSVETRAEQGFLLPTYARTFQIQSARTSEGGFGMSPTWYGTDAVNAHVWRYVQSLRAGAAPASQKSPAKKPPINTDPEFRRKVEKAAVDHATAYFQSPEGGTYVVESVEPFGRGWDLEATKDGGELLIEVKGLQGSDLVCELTPNEYKKMMMSAHRDKYVIYVVNNALAQTPIASIFKRTADGQWEADDGRTLAIKEQIGAVLSCG